MLLHEGISAIHTKIKIENSMKAKMQFSALYPLESVKDQSISFH